MASSSVRLLASVLFLVIILGPAIEAKAQQVDQSSAVPRGPRPVPEPGACPLPILPALAHETDTTFYAPADVPRGLVVQARYTSMNGEDKRMHVYLPPGYEDDPSVDYPALYLNHGGGENDSHWTAPGHGHANQILDNLIAKGKARPMIVVMPYTPCASYAAPTPGEDDACTQEYLTDIVPYVEMTFRARPERESRALAGLSMGGFVVMNTGLPHLDTFSELYVFSSGYFPDQVERLEENVNDILRDPRTNHLLRVPFYMAQGETDIALVNGMATLAVFNKAAVRNFWVLSTGGHEWMNWRRYLHQTAQIMFPDCD